MDRRRTDLRMSLRWMETVFRDKRVPRRGSAIDETTSVGFSRAEADPRALYNIIPVIIFCGEIISPEPCVPRGKIPVSP